MSKIKYDDVRHMTTEKREEMFDELDTAVEAIFNDYAFPEWRDA